MELNFPGFTNKIFSFLEKLGKNNSREWFENNKTEYQNNFLVPARLFVTDIAPFFHSRNSQFRLDPKINFTIKKQYYDRRFHDGPPLRDYFLIRFGRFNGDCEFFIYFSKDEVQTGLYLNNLRHDQIFLSYKLKENPQNFIKLLSESGLDKNISLYRLGKSPEKLKDKFGIKNDFELLLKTKNILLQKVISCDDPVIRSPEFITYALGIFDKLYPLYHFSVTPE